MQEPIYDPQRLRTDKAYQYSLVDEFTAYMESLPEYADRVRYFMRICEAMAIAPNSLNGGTRTIYERICFSGQDEGKPVDREGNVLIAKHWGIKPYYDDDNVQKSIKCKLYFIDFYLPNNRELYGFKVRPITELTATYLQKIAAIPNPEAFRQSELRTVGRTIEKYQAKINDWSKEYPASKASKQIIEQFKEASQLVEDEINGSPAIEWWLFHQPYHLNPFALLWDITAYKLFLEQSQPARTTPPALTPPPTDGPKNTIYILPDARPALIIDLSPYVDASQHKSLEDLINEGSEPDQPIIWLSKQVELGRIFYQRVKSKVEKERQMPTNKTIIAKWICRNFERSEAGTTKKLSESTIYSALCNKGLGKSQ